MPTIIPVPTPKFDPFLLTITQQQYRHHNEEFLSIRKRCQDSSLLRITILYSTSANQRKRRRRKDSADNGGNESDDDGNIDSENSRSDNTINELPDFDLNDDAVTTSNSIKRSPTSSTSRGSEATFPIDPLVGEITPNMMATSNNRVASSTSSSTTSVKDLLRDRSLEQKLELLYDDSIPNDAIDQEVLPDLLVLQKQKNTPNPTMVDSKISSLSKRERQILARQQQEAEKPKNSVLDDDDDTLGNILKNLPFITNERGNVEGTKVLETATWACIIALILWELYINSPLFSRAAPIIPVVYEIWM
jgi:hypothetical protein